MENGNRAGSRYANRNRNRTDAGFFPKYQTSIFNNIYIHWLHRRSKNNDEYRKNYSKMKLWKANKR